MNGKSRALPRAVLTASFALAFLGCASAPQPVERVIVQDASGFQNAIETVAQAALPCVVHIDVSGTSLQQVTPDSPLGMFSNQPQGILKVPMRALGSGILISSEGFIITNNHVVENAESITVHFHDGAERPARLVGSDRLTDIAVIKVDPPGNVRVARLGDSDALQVGQWVVAIGSPHGLDWTVTAGIVSATHRASLSSRAPAGLEDFIQTDAAINPGNSGGPLLDLSGAVVGMNAMIMSQSSGSEGLGFAIPSNLVRSVAQTLMSKGKVTRGDLGLATQDLTDSVRKALKIPSGARGVVVTEAVPLGPGAAAAIAPGDLITSFQQSPVATAAQFNRLTASTPPGTVVILGLIRDNAPRSVTLTVVDQLALFEKQAARPGYALLGIRVNPVSAELAQSIGMGDPSGVVVVEVVPGSPADSVGVGNGDIIFQVDGETVNDEEQFRQHVGDAIKTGTVVVLLRDGQSGRTGYMEIPIN